MELLAKGGGFKPPGRPSGYGPIYLTCYGPMYLTMIYLAISHLLIFIFGSKILQISARV